MNVHDSGDHIAPAGVTHAFDSPVEQILPEVFRVSGWFLDSEGQPASRIRLLMNGEVVASATRGFRFDLAKVRSDLPDAVLGGFYGDVVAGAEMAGRQFSLAADFLTVDGKLHLCTLGDGFTTTPAAPLVSRRRSFDCDDLLSGTAAALPPRAPEGQGIRRRQAGVDQFFQAGAPPLVRLTEQARTHQYPSNIDMLIAALPPDGIFLDLGCGIRPEINVHANGVYLDAVHFPGVDIVNTLPALPFKDATFDLIFSMAVFEHLPDPWGMAREMFRILKPGGKCYIETAFMQPFHGDPDHYFNMTEPALRLIFRDFTVERTGVAPHQTPSNGLIMQIEAVEQLVADEIWTTRLSLVKDLLLRQGRDLDTALGSVGQRVLAAGIYLMASRPSNSRVAGVEPIK